MKSVTSDFRRLFATLLAVGLAATTYAGTYTFTPSDGEGDPDDIWDLDHAKYFTWGIKNFAIPTGERIVDATLSIYNINNWTSSENTTYGANGSVTKRNWLNMWLLDEVYVSTLSSGRVTNTRYEGNSPTGTLKMWNDTDGSPDAFSTWQDGYNSAWGSKAYLEGSIAKARIGVYTDDFGGDGYHYVNGVRVSNIEPVITYRFSSLNLVDDLSSFIESGGNFGLGFDPDCHYYNTGVSFTIYTERISVPDSASTALLLSLGLAGVVGFRRRSRNHR